MKMLIELFLDGYDTNEEMNDACIEFVHEQLDFSASDIKVLWAEDPDKEEEK